MNIVANQRCAYVNRALSIARLLAGELVNLSPAQGAAILAVVAADSHIDLDFVYLAQDPSDEMDAALIADVLPRCCGERFSWRVGERSQFSIVSLTPKGVPE